MKTLTYDIVVATRNRPDALALSIPHMLRQSRLPGRLIVVDSSDDPAPARRAVESAVPPSSKVEVIVHPVTADERGLVLQRNRGLQYVTAPIVFFPDDDSIWFAGVAESIMAVYERDDDDSISAVCGAESPTPPPDFAGNRGNAYAMRKADRVQRRVAPMRTYLEKRVFPDPAKLLGQAFAAGLAPASWWRDLDVVPVEWMTGFRMSFRTAVARMAGFDTNFRAYSLFEDVEASFAAWKHGAVVACRKAQIYHHKSPERRGDPYRLAVEQLLNKAYIVSKYTVPGHPARLALASFARYKLIIYSTGLTNTYGRKRLQGALRATRYLRAFMRVPAAQAADLYRQTITACTSG